MTTGVGNILILSLVQCLRCPVSHLRDVGSILGPGDMAYEYFSLLEQFLQEGINVCSLLSTHVYHVLWCDSTDLITAEV